MPLKFPQNKFISRLFRVFGKSVKAILLLGTNAFLNIFASAKKEVRRISGKRFC